MTSGSRRREEAGNFLYVPRSPPVKLGVAQVDITPDYPVRLSGFGFRRTESEGITHRIWAKALAIDDQVNGPAGGPIYAGELLLAVEFLQQRLQPALVRQHHIPCLLAE